ncbi:MAG: cytochrome c peroxidase [Bacteroidia bacterium]|nr:cytochrome c peroxidase [Bacteroidia bacterium]
MRNRLRYILPLIGIVGLGAVLSFRQPLTADAPAAQVAGEMRSRLVTFEQEVQQLARYARQFPDTVSLADLRRQHLATRQAFKAFEVIGAYLDGELVRDYINGAPLPKVERNVPSDIKILSPEGLQVLDELIFDDEAEGLRDEINRKAEVLNTQARAWAAEYQRGIPLTSRMVFEASRAGLIRVFTQGLTGFDTPGSLQAVPEAATVIRSIAGMMAIYEPSLAATSPGLADSLHQTLQAAAGYLDSHPDFETFDRLYYVRTYINPLYAMIGAAQAALSIETVHDVSRYPVPVQQAVRDIFSPDLLDRTYFAGPDAAYQSRRAELGQLLFFDPVLSRDNTGSCATCHQPGRAFTDGYPKSLAMNGDGDVGRNAPTVIDAVFARRYFHDMRSEYLASQIEHVIANEKEFHTDYWQIFDKLNQSPEYVSLFKAAFPDQKQPVSRHTLTMSLAAYVQSLVSWNSPFDQYVRGEREDLSPQAKLGFNLFMGKAACGTCHFAPVFNGLVPPDYDDSEGEVLGVPATPGKHPVLDPDLGRVANGRLPEAVHIYKHAFKTPTVRNVALTAPYMHNGVYQTLEEVVDFYNKGGGAGLGFDLPNQTLPPDPLGLNRREVKALVAFMESLTDTTGLTAVPARLPAFPEGSPLNTRTVGGGY